MRRKKEEREINNRPFPPVSGREEIEGTLRP